MKSAFKKGQRVRTNAQGKRYYTQPHDVRANCEGEIVEVVSSVIRIRVGNQVVNMYDNCIEVVR